LAAFSIKSMLKSVKGKEIEKTIGAYLKSSTYLWRGYRLFFTPAHQFLRKC